MVTSINQRITNSGSLERAVEEGVNSRLRPVLMAALIAALGLIPLLLATGAGSEIQRRPLATVVVGGLISSTLLTLLVIPALYSWFSRGWLRDNLRVDRDIQVILNLLAYTVLP